MTFHLVFTDEAAANLHELEKTAHLKKRVKAVKKILGFLELNPRHPSLRTHKFHSFSGAQGEDVFEAYAENQTPGAYRIFWLYGPGKGKITILAITPHP